MAERFRASEKKVQKMTGEGAIEENLAKKTYKRVSKRIKDVDFSGYRKAEHNDADEIEKDRKKKSRSRSPSNRRHRLRFEENEPDKDSENRSLSKKNARKERDAAGKIKDKAKKKKIYDEERKKKKAKIRFDDETVKTREKDVLPGYHAASIGQAVSKQMQDDDEQDDNAAVDGAEAGGRGVDSALRFSSRRSAKRKRKQYERTHKLEERSLRSKAERHYRERLGQDEKLKNSNAMKRFIQKQRIKRQYMKAYRAEKTGSTAAANGIGFMKRASRKVMSFFAQHKGIALSIAALVLVLVVVMNSVTSCSMGGVQVIAGTMASSYLSEPEDIEKAELYYTELEAALQKKINEMEKEHPGLDEYRYNIGEISHDPHTLISYLSAKYEVFTFDQVKGEIESLFAAQYGLDVETVKETREETKTVKVGESLGKVVTSGYCSCRICCGIWSGGPTASGVMPRGNHTVAVDANDPIVPMGTKIVMNGIEYTVEDTGNFARYGVAFDVYYDNHVAASNHGHRTWEAFLAEGSQNTVEVTKTETVEVLNVTMAAKSLSMVVQSRMNEEQKELYGYIYAAKGNLQICTTPVDLNWYNYIKSYYGYQINPGTGQRELHRGIEISVEEGTQVKSGQTGMVVNTGYSDIYGHYVVTEDDKGYQLKYAHLQSIQVTKGQRIIAGDVIGKTGSSGSVTGSQLYLELVKEEVYYNPIFYVDPNESGFGIGSDSGGAAYDDETVQRLFDEAEKYLGMPYVWGGSSPSTSFDCSGFVWYVFKAVGIWDIGRTTAQGLYGQCTAIDPSEALPGDIIFFTGTYNAGVPVTHVGIYAGDGMMIHCGNPIQYASINSPY